MQSDVQQLSSLLLRCQDPADFSALAHTLLTSCHLVLQPPPPPPSPRCSSSSPSPRRFLLSDIEFYHAHPPTHLDPFAHAHESQVHSGTWYFHAAGSTGFKEGSYKGLDVTFGDASSRSGILIRRIAEVVRAEGGAGWTVTAAAIDGPSLVCDAILAAMGFSKVRDFVRWLQDHPSGCGLDACSPFAPLRLELLQEPQPQPGAARARLTATQTVPLELGRVWACPRHGLSLKRTKTASSEELRTRLQYITRPYRFLSARPQKGAINLAFGILHDLAASQSSAEVTISSHRSAVTEHMYPTEAAARARASRTVATFLDYFESGHMRKHPTAFAGSGLASTREVGELYGSLLAWDGQLRPSARDTTTAATGPGAASKSILPPCGGPSEHSHDAAPLPPRTSAASKRKADTSAAETSKYFKGANGGGGTDMAMKLASDEARAARLLRRSAHRRGDDQAIPE